ncbi:tryptophan 2,3-dioxygenase [Duganella sp. Leaf126]|uniref:tryptophan 2,3-dioxygenase n=1 Tax=Duganella sp. Leaf126 TaxID=1736266 RepID=UPI0006FAFBF1|nr:tryptophan 2,3-dioxygenase [Duganella sp. Leaf126]KQQ30959.1 tryptophan 2,3-dioxygenase [Duganella sp. Leaf126]
MTCPLSSGVAAGDAADTSDAAAPAAGYHGAQLDFSADMSYGDYLSLDTILSAQHPRSPEHNELLFIIQHQTSELWMKLMLHELHGARDNIAAGQLPAAMKMLARVAAIMNQLVHAWDVLATMTPPEYTAIRPYLGASSGFQSHQYREIEFLLGNKNATHLQVHRHKPEAYTLLERALAQPSIYDQAILVMARSGLAVDAARLAGPWDQPIRSDASVKAAWTTVYRNTDRYWPLYELAEKLVDLETAFRLWRFRHVTTVQRVIGFKMGTGGTDGVNYLRKMLDVVLFPELFELRTEL